MKSKQARLLLLGLPLLSVLVIVHHSTKTVPLSETAAPSAALNKSQDSTSTNTRSLRSRLRLRPATHELLAKTNNPSLPGPGQKVMVEYHGTWYRAEVLKSSGGSNYISYVGYTSEWNEWVTADRMRPITEQDQDEIISYPIKSVVDTSTQVRMKPQVGDPVALHGGQWWRVEVLKTEGDKSLIRYVGYGAEWDEWVGPDRFKVFAEKDVQTIALDTSISTSFDLPIQNVTGDTAVDFTLSLDPATNAAPVIRGKPVQGDLLVHWGQEWWPAEVLKQEGDRYLIHYKNYGDQWDEWVSLDRMSIFEGQASGDVPATKNHLKNRP